MSVNLLEGIFLRTTNNGHDNIYLGKEEEVLLPNIIIIQLSGYNTMWSTVCHLKAVLVQYHVMS